MKFSMNDSLAAVEMCKKWKLGLNASFLKKSWAAATEKSKMFCKMQRKKFHSFPTHGG